jgi:hypothetical protein
MTTQSDVAGRVHAIRPYFRFGLRAARDAPSREFLLTAACCRWPPSESRNAAIRAAAAGVTDWSCFLRVVKRHRVVGLVHTALLSACVELPSPVAQELASGALRIARQNLVLVAETVRLQRALDAACIPVMVLKGVSLAQLAYGSLNSKHARDIDLLVPPDRAEAALQLIERESYALSSPAERLSEAQRRAVVRYGREFELVRHGSNLLVELQWRVAYNPLLLKGIDAYSSTQNVSLADGASIRTLTEEDLFAYLCVHGAYHAWSRLKWLADVNALIAANETGITRLYRHAQGRGAGPCAGQALLLCHRLFNLRLPLGLAAEIQGNRKSGRLEATDLKAMTDPHTEMKVERTSRSRDRHVLRQFSLGQGWAFFAAQCRVASVGLVDVIHLPLPASLHFLYPLLRVPLWLWWHLARSDSSQPRKRV